MSRGKKNYSDQIWGVVGNHDPALQKSVPCLSGFSGIWVPEAQSH
jgi:hypothetical protein